MYFATCITDAILEDPKLDVTTITVSTKTVCKECVYQILKTGEGKQTILNGFRAAGITDTDGKTRLNSVVDSLNPYM